MDSIGRFLFAISIERDLLESILSEEKDDTLGE